MREIRLVRGISTQNTVLSDEIVGDYVVDVEGNEPTLIKNFESEEVVTISPSDTINSLRRKGYIVDVGDIKVGTTKIMYRKNCLLHSVKPLENLNDIASYYNINPQKIIDDNNLETSKLYIGQILVIQ